MSTRPMRIALVGAGNIAGKHLVAATRLADRVEVVAICDVVEATARRRAAEAGVEAVHTDYGRLLSEVECDAVLLTTVHCDHAAQMHAALEAGRHVLVEKPMTTSLADAVSVAGAARRRGLTVMVGQCQRFDPWYRGARHVVRSGELGVVQAVRLDCMQELKGSAPPTHWMFDGAKAGGGIVIGAAIHRIDLARFLVGEVRRVHAVARTSPGPFRGGAEDFLAATLEFDNGAVGDLFATYSGYRMPWAEQFMIFGTRGMLHAVPPIGQRLGRPVVASDSRPLPEGIDPKHRYGGFVPVDPDRSEAPDDDRFVNQLAHFVDCCREHREPDSGADDNVQTLAIVFALYESAAQRRPVEVAEVLERARSKSAS